MWPQITKFLTWVSAPALLWLSPNLLQTTSSLLFYNFVFHCSTALAYFWPSWHCAPASPFALSHISPVEAFGARAVFLLQARAWLQPHPCSTLIFRAIKMTTRLSCIKMSKCQIGLLLEARRKNHNSYLQVSPCHESHLLPWLYLLPLSAKAGIVQGVSSKLPAGCAKACYFSQEKKYLLFWKPHFAAM